MGRTDTHISDLEQTLKKEGLSPQIRTALNNKLKNLKENQIVNK